jgi:ATP-dependent DNA helicase RecG
LSQEADHREEVEVELSLEQSAAEQKLTPKQIEFLTTGIPMTDLKSFTTLQKESNSEAGFDTLASLLQHYPRDYLYYSPTAFQDGEFICSQGAVKSVSSFCKGNKGFINAVVEINDMNYGMHTVHIKQWLHFRTNAQRPLWGIVAKYPVGSLMAFKGKLKERAKSETTWDLTGKVEMTPLDEFVAIEKEIIPVYPRRGSLKGTYFNKAMIKAVASFDTIAEEEGEHREFELLPLNVVQKYGLMSLREAIHAIHFPATSEDAEKARKRLVFQELYLLQSALMLRRYQLQTPRNNVDAKGISVSGSALLERAVVNLPYQLTSAQERVLGEVIEDMVGAPPMMRLLQGDVGSGKTIVAILAMLSVVDSGWQCALMVPTEILAAQHAQKLEDFLSLLKQNDSTFDAPKVLLLTGSMKVGEKREVLEATSDGSASITIGTHALISEGVQFKKLGLAVIDEQHKFGVEQRSKLQSKNEPPPHLLSMSATPIPRTLALTMYGEMSLSYIDESPPGRKPIETRVYKQANAVLRSQAYEKMVSEVKLGNKGFVVFPLIDQSEYEDFQAIKAAEASFYDLERNELKGIPCGLLHGRLQSQDKIEAQDAFIAGKTKVLMATAVIEVGVDIPEATVIIVENAERFGLAQLHQLRGRVGRSDKQSYCFFLTGGSDASHAKIKHMERLDNGFAVSEVDMALRGPGEFLGTKQAGQSGLPSLQLTDMKSEEDKLTLEDAREAAAHAFSKNNEPKLQQSVLLQLQSQPPIPFLDIAPESIQAFE